MADEYLGTSHPLPFPINLEIHFHALRLNLMPNEISRSRLGSAYSR